MSQVLRAESSDLESGGIIVTMDQMSVQHQRVDSDSTGYLHPETVRKVLVKKARPRGGFVAHDLKR